MKLGTETGSLINHVMSGSSSQAPAVGMGATLLEWTDRTACTIVAVTPCTVTVQADNAKRIDNNGMSECQEYEYSPNPNSITMKFRKNKRGEWRGKHGYLAIGYRRQYYDYSF